MVSLEKFCASMCMPRYYIANLVTISPMQIFYLFLTYEPKSVYAFYVCIKVDKLMLLPYGVILESVNQQLTLECCSSVLRSIYFSKNIISLVILRWLVPKIPCFYGDMLVQNKLVFEKTVWWWGGGRLSRDPISPQEYLHFH